MPIVFATAAGLPKPDGDGTWSDTVRVLSFIAVDEITYAVCLYAGRFHEFKLSELTNVRVGA